MVRDMSKRSPFLNETDDYLRVASGQRLDRATVHASLGHLQDRPWDHSLQSEQFGVVNGLCDGYLRSEITTWRYKRSKLATHSSSLRRGRCSTKTRAGHAENPVENPSDQRIHT